MSETVVSNLIIYGLTTLSTIALAAIAAWKTAKMGAHSGATEAMEPVTDQLKTNSAKLDTIHEQTNSTLEDFKVLIRKEATATLEDALKNQSAMVATAIQQGIAQGIEQERQRQEKIGGAK